MNTTQLQPSPSITGVADRGTSTWTIDPSHSTVGFSVKHLMISTVRGRFLSYNATITLDEANPLRSRVEATVETNSVDTRSELRDNHLRTSDFFDVANHPQLTFVSRRIEGDIEGAFKLIGELTMRGVTREVVFDASFEGTVRDPWGNDRRGFTARTKVNRYDFGLMWNQGLEAGGTTVSSDVKIEIEAEFVKATA
ncbi:MAG: YceI family protein [Gemmatimonadaceae bacterium]